MRSNYPPNKIMLVINKMDRRSGITAQMIEDNIKHQVVGQIPLDEILVLNSINRGVPFMVDQRTKPIGAGRCNNWPSAWRQSSSGRQKRLPVPADEARKKTGLFR